MSAFRGLCAGAVLGLMALQAAAQVPVTQPGLPLAATDVLPTGNEWISLPEIRADDGAIATFNVLSMHYRGLLQVGGARGTPLLRPVVLVDGQPLAAGSLSWSVRAYWIPVGVATLRDVQVELTYCAPRDARAAFVHVRVRNQRHGPARVQIGVDTLWGELARVTYQPVALSGHRSVRPGAWVDDSEAYAYATDDTQFAWAVLHPGMKAFLSVTGDPGASARSDEVELAPGQSLERDIILAPGLEEFSAPHNAKALRERIDRLGAQAVVDETAAWLMARTRTTGDARLDLLMNRNAFFTRFYAWGRTIDTEAWVGVTSRSPRYYVSAAYWDRDAMLWSFPGLLRFDPEMAREALDVALGLQLRNTGVHSRFIDGSVLEDGFQLDAAVAPILALHAYLQRTADLAYLREHQPQLARLSRALLGHKDAATGLYASWQDAQDEYRRQPFLTVDNVLTWKALLALSDLHASLGDAAGSAAWRAEALGLDAAIRRHLIAPHDGQPRIAAGWDGKDDRLWEDIPPGSLFRLPSLGFIDGQSAEFLATADWLHSPAYRYGFSGAPYGLPGSYRLPFTTSWSLADHLRLPRERERALRILLASQWDGGIITEGVDPDTARMDRAGRAFATAAGYVADAICDVYCKEP